MTKRKTKPIPAASPLPCPGCLSTNVYAGIESSDAMQVKCLDCGLKMTERCPDEWPKGCRGVMTVEKRIERWRAWTLQRAIERWNRRLPGFPDVVRKVMVGVADTADSCGWAAARNDKPLMKSQLIAAQQRLENLAEILRLLIEGEVKRETPD